MMADLALRTPKGEIQQVPSAAAVEHSTSGGERCTVRAGHVCDHGYRVDPASVTRRDGDGCRVVALNEDRALQRVTWHVPGDVHRAMLALQPGEQVEVLLDDGRVVETTTRSEVWGPRDSELIQLDGFRGGFSVQRLRPLGWRWSKRLGGAP